MGLFGILASWLGPEPPLEEMLGQAIDHAVQVVEPAMRAVGGLEHKLAPAASHALSYCSDLVAQLAPAVEVNARAFASDPLVHALFGSAEQIDTMVGRCQPLRDFLADPGNAFSGECFALLGMRRHEKTVLGLAQQGALIHADAPRRLLFYADHTLRDPAPSEEETRARLKMAAFHSLVVSFADQLQEQRKAREELRYAWDSERASGAGDLGRDEKDWRLAALATRMQESAEALAPERIVEALSAWLLAPDEKLYLKPYSARVDSLGVMMPADSGEGDEIQCKELMGRDRRHWTLQLVRLNCEEAREAVARQAQLEQAMRTLLI
ncbi:MAG TPA: hypothetical protein VI279_01865 [Rhodocyclaceae bacterium]